MPKRFDWIHSDLFTFLSIGPGFSRLTDGCRCLLSKYTLEGASRSGKAEVYCSHSLYLSTPHNHQSHKIAPKYTPKFNLHTDLITFRDNMQFGLGTVVRKSMGFNIHERCIRYTAKEQILSSCFASYKNSE